MKMIEKTVFGSEGRNNMKKRKIYRRMLLFAAPWMILGAGIFMGSQRIDAGERMPDERLSETEEYDWEYDVPVGSLDADGTLTISGTGDILSFWGEWEEADRADEVKKIVVTVTGSSDAYFFFKEFENLESVDLEGFDASNITDFSYLFSECKKLKAVKFGMI